ESYHCLSNVDAARLKLKLFKDATAVAHAKGRNPLILLELRGVLFFLGPESSGDGGDVLPSRFEGCCWGKRGEKGSLCELGLQSQPLILLELREVLFFLGPESSGDGGDVLPSRFEGCCWGKRGEKGRYRLGGKHCAQHSVLKRE
nr:hypothetical protein [Tanacetum cinerariifolium]